VEGILAFAERVLARAADLWVQASLEQRQRLQQLFFPDGIAFDGKSLVETGVTAPTFSYLRQIEGGNEGLAGDYFGTECATSNYAVLYTAKGAASIAGGVLAALLFERFGTSAGFYGSAALALIAAGLAVGLYLAGAPGRVVAPLPAVSRS
jgi:hypothetical protein